MSTKIVSSLIALCVVGVASNAFAQEVVAPKEVEVVAPEWLSPATVVVLTSPAVEPVVPSEPIALPVAPAPVVNQYDNSSYYHHTEYHPDIQASLNPSARFRVGMSADVGFPSGASIGVLVSPWLPWLKVGVSGNYNYVGEGLSGHITLDPFRSPIGLTLTGEAGTFFPSTVPNVKDSPTLAYTYETALLGLEFGNRSHFRFFLRGGIAHVDANVSNFGNAFTLPAGVSIGSPNVSLVSPAGKLGFDWLF